MRPRKRCSRFGKNHLRGQLGFVLVLHTWDQQLRPHFHLHGLIAGGALGNEEWIPSTPTFLFPVRALSKVFRGKFLAGLECLLQQGKLDVPPALQPTRAQRHWLRRLRRHGWVVYSKAPFAGPGKLLDYLGRYTHKTAISNCRLVALHGDQVTFTWRDRADGDPPQALDAASCRVSEAVFEPRASQGIHADSPVRLSRQSLQAANPKALSRISCCRSAAATFREVVRRVDARTDRHQRRPLSTLRPSTVFGRSSGATATSARGRWSSTAPDQDLRIAETEPHKRPSCKANNRPTVPLRARGPIVHSNVTQPGSRPHATVSVAHPRSLQATEILSPTNVGRVTIPNE